MVWWIALGVVVLGLLVLAVVALSTVRRLAGLRRALARVKEQADTATQFAGSAELQDNLAALQIRMERTQAHLETIKASRDPDGSR